MKVSLFNLPKKLPFHLRTIWAHFGPNLWKLISHDLLTEDLFKVYWHHEVQKIDKISLFQKSPFGAI